MNLSMSINKMWRNTLIDGDNMCYFHKFKDEKNSITGYVDGPISNGKWPVRLFINGVEYYGEIETSKFHKQQQHLISEGCIIILRNKKAWICNCKVLKREIKKAQKVAKNWFSNFE